MTCLKCRGLCYEERITDSMAPFSCCRAYAWKCINCGALIDHVILKNKLKNDLRHPAHA